MRCAVLLLAEHQMSLHVATMKLEQPDGPESLAQACWAAVSGL